LVLLTACTQTAINKPASVTPVNQPVSQQSAWQKRQAFLTRKNTWQLASRASLRLDQENLIFGLNWAQTANNYVIQINNPLTGGLVSKLTRSNGVVSGLTIPLKGMQYWVRGLTAPQYKVDQLVLDGAGRPRTLKQAGWDVSYTSYVNNGTNALPRKINLSRGAEKIFIRLIAKNWK